MVCYRPGWGRRPLYHVETRWFKDDVAVEQSGVAHTFNDLWNRTLSLLNAEPAHQGRYACRVTTKSARQPPVQAQANVTVLGRPYCFFFGWNVADDNWHPPNEPLASTVIDRGVHVPLGRPVPTHSPRFNEALHRSSSPLH